MHFNPHYALEGRHAKFSPSSPSWMNYDEDKLLDRLVTLRAAEIGTRKHNVAAELIRLGLKMPANNSVFNKYVNDAIGWRMTPEQPLYFSDNFFGTADAIGFNPRKMLLRISDLKTGVSKPHIQQLEGYAALFCLEYGFKPFELTMEFRIYQEPEVQVYDGDPDVITHIMSTIKTFDTIIQAREEELA